MNAIQSHDAARMELVYSFEPGRLDFGTIHRWLSGTYWSPGISRERVEQGFMASTLVIGCYTPEGALIGTGRCLTDTTRFAYFSDVYVEDSWRGHGIAREMIRQFLGHPALALVDCAYLFTQDAHGVYRHLGFQEYPHPERLMHRLKTQ